MKEQWNRLYKSIDEYIDLMNVYVKEVAPSVSRKNLKVLMDAVNRISRYAYEFDKVVDPVAPKEIKLPYSTEAFGEVWQDYKDFLAEQHQAYMHSRAEFYSLRRLKKWSGNNEQMAIEILEWLMSTRQKSFFRPSEKQLSGNEPAPAESTPLPTVDLTVDRSKRI